MAADGVLYIDDEDDANLVKAQNVRYLESRMNNYITELAFFVGANKNRSNYND